MTNSDNKTDNVKAASIRVIFIHHSTGANLIKEGNVRLLLQQQAPFIAFWDHGYDPDRFKGSLNFMVHIEPQIYGLRDPSGRLLQTSFHIPNHNTDPDGLSALFKQPVTNPASNALSHILQFDVIIFKSCFPVTAIASERQLQTYKDHYLSIRDTMDKYTNKLFIPMTPPPLRASMTSAQQARQARRFATWIMSEEYHEQRPHVKPYDFFDALANLEKHHQANTLRPEFCRLVPFDSHPNAYANRMVAPRWVSFIIETVQQTAFLHKSKTSDKAQPI